MTAIVLVALLATGLRGQVANSEHQIRIAAAEEQSDANAEESPTPHPKPKAKNPVSSGTQIPYAEEKKEGSGRRGFDANAEKEIDREKGIPESG